MKNFIIGTPSLLSWKQDFPLWRERQCKLCINSCKMCESCFAPADKEKERKYV
jgi:hypothetical protein